MNSGEIVSGNEPPVCLEARQARVVLRSLRQYEQLKPSYVALKKAIAAYRLTHEQDSAAYAYQSGIVNWYRASFAVEQELRQDADKKTQRYKTKARRRTVWVVVLSIVAGGLLLK